MTVPNEPTPVAPTGGAGRMPLDPPQNDVSQEPGPDLDDSNHGSDPRSLMRAAAIGPVTVKQVLTLAASQIGTGESPANVNKYTRWYYGNATAAAWCWIFLCWLFHQLDALGLIFGKHAYVPDFKAVFSPHGEFHTDNPKPGDLVAFDFNGGGTPEHIGIVEKVLSSSHIQTIEGNASDHVMRRTRYRGYVYGYATPKYGTTPAQEDDMPQYVSLGQKKPQPVKKGQTARVVFDVEHSDRGKAHADGAHPGILSGGKNGCQFVTQVDVSGPGTFRLIETNPAKKYTVSKTYPMRSGCATYVGWCDPGQHLYVELHPSADGQMNTAVKAQYWTR